MKFVVYGAGAVGGVVGAQLHRAGHDVTLVARGAHYEAIRDNGLVLETPDERVQLKIPVTDDISSVEFSPDTVVLLTMKTQDTKMALAALQKVAGADTPIVCIQNGVENERLASGLFANVYGIPVMCPCLFVDPGVVQAYSAPLTGILDIGRYPEGDDATAADIAGAFSSATFISEPRPDIMRWKYRKLIRNLRNAVEALFGQDAEDVDIRQLVTTEGERVLAASGIDTISEAEDDARRGSLLTPGQINGATRPGGSVWQSITRQVGTVETDYLSGEIVRLGQTHGVATPVNGLIQRLVTEMAAEGRPPGSLTPDDFFSLLAESF
ncbi:MAG: 2-dehydropantoate 2-reductase [Acidimicrobiia bacterium]|nr:2-dehydropantoate 2-reductase [Acidimicrobiia bacterium]